MTQGNRNINPYLYLRQLGHRTNSNVTGVDDAAVDGNQVTTITVAIDDANSDDGYDVVENQTVPSPQPMTIQQDTPFKKMTDQC